jgi:RNAse (barnase) inhibitor barstar
MFPSVRPEVSSNEQLFEALSQALRLPDYFGRNWDALDECLHDLSWIPERHIMLIHDALPGLDEESLRMYIRLLDRAAEHWYASEEHDLTIVFPPAARETVSQLRGR